MPPLFTSGTRLYELELQGVEAALEVEAWWGVEGLDEGAERIVDVLGPDAFVPLKSFLGRTAVLYCTLADGSRCRRSGLVREAWRLDTDGGFARYRLQVVSSSWLLGQTRHNRVFQDKSVVQIVEQVFAGHAPLLAWRWAGEVGGFLADARARSYCVQYDETDYAFVARLLAEEGLGWCLEEDPEAPAGHRLLLFADSTALAEDDTSAGALGGPGIRYHRADSQEEQDALVALATEHRLHATSLAATSHDYKRKAAVGAQLPTDSAPGGPHAPALESYDCPGLYAWASAAEARRYLTHTLQALEVRRTAYRARGTVRSLRAGRRLTVTGAPPPARADGLELTVAHVTELGINNLTAAHLDALAARLADPRYTAATFEDFADFGLDGFDAFDAFDDAFGGFDAFDQLFERDFDRPPAHAAPHTRDTPSDDPFAAPLPPPSLTAAPTGLAQPAPARPPHVLAPSAELIALALARGYASHFTAHPAERPWRPRQHDDNGTRLNPRPTAPGPMTALVVGPDGQSRPNGPDELWCDALGRIRIRFPWQQGIEADDRHGCWVRVASRQAGPRMGWQWLPRIGQEVLVDFLDGDIDRPVVQGVLYNGQGEGGVPPTPGGAHLREQALELFEQATDHRPAAQGNTAGGHAPAWHGAAGAAHRHPGALSGFRSKEFGGAGYNQLVFDDSDAQLRIQLKSTQAASELNLGHLIHQADNYRGSFRGNGAELRTDAHGAVRAGQGLTLSTWPAPAADGGTAQPAGDFAPGIALLDEARRLADTLARAARTHRGVDLASASGSTAAAQSRLNPAAAPLDAQHLAARGMVEAAGAEDARADAAQRTTAVTGSRVPHLADPIIATAARAGLGLVAGQALQLANGDTLTWSSGAHTNLAVGGQARIHAGQAIGLVAGAIAPGEDGSGLTLIAAHDDIDVQAQGGPFALQARDTLDLASLAEHIDFAAAKRIVIAVDGGASITLDGSITVKCPGTLTVHAGKKSFSGPTRMNRDHPDFPMGSFTTPLRIEFDHAAQGLHSAWQGMPYTLFADGARIGEGVLDDSGSLLVEHSPASREYLVELANGVRYALPVDSRFADQRKDALANLGILGHQPGMATETGATDAASTPLDLYAAALEAAGRIKP